MPGKNEIIRTALAGWYAECKRDLPWRETRDAYRIWISEVILQQTRVAQGLAYYERFMERFPTVKHLADAHEDEVLRLWQGLGYYSRARNLHAAARQVVELYGSVFPTRYEEVLALRGVGEYTAAAICSFAYKLPYAVLDGNVYRVLSRLYGVDVPMDSGEGRRLFRALADELLDEQNPDVHNQAMMELGALQCVPQGASCDACVLCEQCVAYAQGNVSALPVKQGRTKVRNRYFNYVQFVTTHEGQDFTWLVKRTEKDVWQHLWEFPLVESEESLLELNDLILSDMVSSWLDSDVVVGVRVESESGVMKHVLSHQRIFARFVTVRLSQLSDLQLAQGQWVVISDISKYAVSRLMDLFLERCVSLG